MTDQPIDPPPGPDVAALTNAIYDDGCALCGARKEHSSCHVDLRMRNGETRAAGLCRLCHAKLLAKRVMGTVLMILPVPLLLVVAEWLEPSWPAGLVLALYSLHFLMRVRYSWADRLLLGLASDVRLPVGALPGAARVLLAALSAWGAHSLAVAHLDCVAEAREPLAAAVSESPAAAARPTMDPETSKRFMRRIRAGDEERVRALVLEHPDLVRFRDRHGKTPLHLASRNAPITVFLLEKGAPVNARDEVFHETPLHWAARANRVEVVKLLLAHGADVEAKTKKGDTALSIALRHRMKRITVILKAAGAHQ